MAKDTQIKFKGLSDTELAQRVMNGEFGNGVDRQNALGDRYSAVQDIVNGVYNGSIDIVDLSIDTNTTEQPEQQEVEINNNVTEENIEVEQETEDNTAPEEPVEIEDDVASIMEEDINTWQGPVLNSVLGRIQGPSGEETFYNLDMSKVVSDCQPGGKAYNEAAAYGNERNLSSNIWTREDGAKMMGDYIMVAANLSVHPRGSIVETSLGKGIVVDTGTFASINPTQLDIATNW